MKQLWWILAFLALVAIVLAVPIVTRLAMPERDCRGSVVITKGAHGEPLECVCIEGTLATCFNPGP